MSKWEGKRKYSFSKSEQNKEEAGNQKWGILKNWGYEKEAIKWINIYSGLVICTQSKAKKESERMFEWGAENEYILIWKRY